MLHKGRRLRLLLGVISVVLGVALLAFAGYYGLGFLSAGNDSGEFDVSRSADVLAPVQVSAGANHPARSLSSIYPADFTAPKYWSVHQNATDEPFAPPSIPDDFTIVGEDYVVSLEDDPSAYATRVRIPAIHLDSSVAPLKLIDLGDSQQYETPANTVGFIPETSAPGGSGTGWYFGHLESFGHNEGSVFRNLPDVSGLIKNDPVDIYLTTDESEYIYRVYQTSQVSAEELSLQEYGPGTITLCTCWPPKIYTERVLVTAKLIAVKNASQGIFAS